MPKKLTPWGDHLLQAYEKMMGHLVEQIKELSDKVTPPIEQALTQVKQKAIELEELSVHEAEHLAEVIGKDLRSAGQYLSSGSKELGDWFKFDVNQVEDRFLEQFTKAADQTAIELLKLKERAWEVAHYNTGEITGPGTLICEACQEELHFRAPGHVPPCPKCHKTLFVRPGSAE